MSWIVNDREFAAVSALDGPGRYEYFVHKVVDWEEIWGLASEDGWVQFGDDQGREYLAVWPHRRYAEAFARGENDGSEPRSIPLEVWMEKWLPGMAQDGHLVAIFPVFPLLPGNSVAIAPEQLRLDLEEELAKYE